MARNMTDYHATMRDFHLEVPPRFNWAFDTFDAWARDSAKLALLWVSADGQPRPFTFAELGERSRRFANALSGLGVAPGERVFVMLPRVYQWWMGPAAPGHRLAIVDDEGRELPRESEGDLAIQVVPERPVGMFKEYWKNPDATARCHRGDWYITGDRASMDTDGYLWFVGRADDVINSASYRIGPFEVESALVEHPAVAESAVIGKSDALRGEIVKAFVVLAPGHTPSDALVGELQEHVRTVTAPYKYPREIEFVPDLPKTISGKIRRTELRQMERERGRGQTPSRPRGETAG